MKVKSKLTYEGAKAELSSLKEELEVAKTELKDFLKANKLKRDEDHSAHADKKIAKGFKAVSEAVATKQARKDKLVEFMKANKPAPEARESKYNYPAEVQTTLDKKKFRATMRSNAKKAKVDLDTYLANPTKYAKIIAEAVKAKAESGEKKKKKKKKVAAAEEAPVKKLKLKSSDEPVKKKKKKIAPAPEAEEEEDGGAED